ncbi:MAG: epimerase, partial [Terracidiphilus sp.]
MTSSPLLPRPLRIVLPGGSGQVGQMLARFFQERGHHVIVLTRGPYTAPWQTVHWDGAHPGPWVETLEGADVCIHLSGRSVNCRSTPRNRRELYDSRIGPTRLLNQVIAALDNPPRVWLNASTATIYRHALDRDMDEATGEIGGGELIGKRRRAPAKWNWTIELVKAWESAFFETETPRTRKIALRTSLVFSPTHGNVFSVLSNLVRFGLGGTQGNGRQYVSWMHEADFARAIEFLIDREEIAGPVNLAAPNPLPNREFMQAL